jgi:uncharacterized protein YeaO (DUF488 family)
MAVAVKRIYDTITEKDGYRILVDRLWPRGMKKESAPIDTWLKEVAPSTALRQWFNHDPAKWEQFIEKYKKELAGNEAFDALKQLVKKHRKVTLLYASRNETHNHALVLQQLLKQ